MCGCDPPDYDAALEHHGVCGGQTHAIVRFGLDEILPREITLIHGRVPVCVTPIEIIDKAIAIAARPEVIFCSFGDMLRVPGSQRDLLAVKSAGGTCGLSTRRWTP